jgi:hypothetical protein
MCIEKFKKSQMFTRKSKNLERLGYNFSNPVDVEYYSFRDKIADLYLIQGESMSTLMKMFNVPSSKTFFLLFNILDIETRSLSEANIQAIYLGRTNISEEFNFTSKQEWHTSWSGERCFLRSSYEKEYAILLDSKQIEYKTEAFRIRFYDSVSKKTKIAIPDFYLPFENKIIEIKSSYWYTEQLMKDKFKRYKELGFNTLLILDKKEVNL